MRSREYTSCAASTNAFAQQLNISKFDVRAAGWIRWMEEVAASLAIQEIELVKLEEEVEQLLAWKTEEDQVLDPPEDLVKARVENEKLKYGI